MTINELFEKMKTASDEQNEEALNVFNEMLMAIKRTYPSQYKKYSEKLEQIYHSEHISKEEAMEYVSGMVNKDGSTGEHWTLEQTKSYQKSHPSYASIDPYCFYVAINMMYSDYYTPGRSVETYADLASSFLNDKDAPSDKLKRYMEAMK